MESDVGTRDQGNQDCSLDSYDEDNDLWEEQVIDANYVLQEAQYSDIVMPDPHQSHSPYAAFPFTPSVFPSNVI